MKQTLYLMIPLIFTMQAFAQKVGIGTLTPANMLSVNGSADFSDSVGIGVVHPTKKLDVNGEALINGLTVGQGGGNQIFNTALGVNTLLANTTSIQNTAIGYQSLVSANGGGDNVGVGASALNANTTGSGNTAIGYNALQLNTTGSNNTGIGRNAGVSTSNLTNTTAIGLNAAVNTNNSLILGNNANVGIGISNPSVKLEVVGTTKTTNLQMTSGAANGFILKSDANGNGSWANLNTIEVDPQIGTLTSNRIPRWNGSALEDGILFDNGTNIGLGTTSTGAVLDIRAKNVGLRVLSGGTGAGNHTSFRIGRTSTDGTLGVAAAASQYAVGANPGDVILRTEQTTQRLIIHSGTSTPTVSVLNGKVGLDVLSPVNMLDVNGGMAVGSAYSGTSLAPTNGAIIQGNVGIGTNNPLLPLHAIVPFPKTNTNTNAVALYRTNDPAFLNPFGLSTSIVGAADLQNRNVVFQTEEEVQGGNPTPGGFMSIQPDGGQVSIGSVNPNTTLNVEGGIRTKYTGTNVIYTDTGVSDYNLTLSSTPPNDWNSGNTITLVSVCDGAPGLIKQVYFSGSNTIVIKFYTLDSDYARFNFIVFKM